MDTYTLFERIFATVFPLVAIVSIGYFYARRVTTDMAVANQINIDIFVPALIFSVVSAKSFNLPQFQLLALASAIIILGSGLLLWPLCRFLGVKAKTFLPPMMFGNTGNLGIPLTILAFGESALPAAVVMFLMANVLHFTLGVSMLKGKSNPLEIFKMPIIWATIAGLAVSTLNWSVPDVVALPIDMLGKISIPLMLFALGVRLTNVDFSDWRAGIWGGILAPVSGILIAMLVQQFLQLPETQYRYLLLFGALPPALLNYMLAERYQHEPQTVASIVLIGNMMALGIIPLMLYFIL